MSLLNNGRFSSTSEHLENHKRVVDYLINKFRICQEDAEDAVQSAVLIILEKKHNKSLDSLENTVGYTYSVLKNECFKIIRNDRRISYSVEEKTNDYVVPNQLNDIDKAEKMRLLDGCLSHMNEFNKSFFQYILDHPEKSVNEVATYFGIKKHSVYTRRHRLQKIISTCVARKINYYAQRNL
ncbi:MAG: sigma-70 family RNA polymerase sigma factor [Bacteroidetes bacterium]|nr:sigma-70 family RNA polymerase sigma factor [Bacteroidota bacterium]MCH8523675.1 sigma-70 family RNA polymerase sigma factor [Balneolales bacterium]